MYWKNVRVLVTGGASFIGSHLVDSLVARGARVRVVDDLSSGKLSNIAGHLKRRRVTFLRGDLKDAGLVRQALRGQEYVFHLAADHGGRGYVDLHQAGPASNLMLDGNVFWHAAKAKVKKVVFASSGCVYPNYIQRDPRTVLYLKERLVGPPYDADNLYGWAKLMGEFTLQAYHRELGLPSASVRYFTVYGPRGVENHAVIAMIARAFVKENPFEVWGTGRQIRNWTYIDDIVRGTILAAEKISDGTAVNLGTMERVRVIDAVKEVMRLMDAGAPVKLRPDMPTGPYNRVADNRLAQQLLGWKPQVPFFEGLRRTIDWYVRTKKVGQVRRDLARKLTER